MTLVSGWWSKKSQKERHMKTTGCDHNCYYRYMSLFCVRDCWTAKTFSLWELQERNPYWLNAIFPINHLSGQGRFAFPTHRVLFVETVDWLLLHEDGLVITILVMKSDSCAWRQGTKLSSTLIGTESVIIQLCLQVSCNGCERNEAKWRCHSQRSD